jgi:hypothetical protein
VVRDVEGGWVWGRVLKVDNDDLLTVTGHKKNDQIREVVAIKGRLEKD